MRGELSDINSIKLPRSEGTGFIYLFFREEHIECDARIITDVSMGTCLHGDNLGKFTRRTKWSICVCAWRRRGQSAKPACVSNMHFYVCAHACVYFCGLIKQPEYSDQRIPNKSAYLHGSAFAHQFLVANFVLCALSVLSLHPHLRNSFHLHSSHWRGKKKYNLL